MAKNSKNKILNSLQGTVVSYKNPTSPVGQGDWELLKNKKQVKTVPNHK